ncbi:acyltransferase family protein [Clostridium perfringens]|nr:acyltransferase family protein [Clostridium perfringens]
MLKNNKKGLIIIFSFVLAISFCWLLLIKPEINEFNRIYYGTDTRVIPFILGILIELVLVNDENQLIELSESSKSKIKYPLILFLVVLGFLFYVLSFNVMNIKYIIIISSILFAIITIFFLLLNFNRENRFLNILYFIGKNSLVIYLFHWPVIVILKEYGSTSIIRAIILIILTSLIRYIILIKYNIFKKYNLIKLVIILILCISMNNYWIPKEVNKVSTKPVLSENKDSDIRLLVIGDSWGRYIGNSLNNIAEKEKISVLNDAIAGFGIMKPEYYVSSDGVKTKPDSVFYNYLEKWQESINQFKPTYVSIILGNYDQSLQVIDGKELRVGEKEFDELYKKNLK